MSSDPCRWILERALKTSDDYRVKFVFDSLVKNPNLKRILRPLSITLFQVFEVFSQHPLKRLNTGTIFSSKITNYPKLFFSWICFFLFYFFPKISFQKFPKNLNFSKNFETISLLGPVWPDWTIFKVLGNKMTGSKRSQNDWQLFELFWKTSLLCNNCFLATFWATFGKFWVTFYSKIWSHWCWLRDGLKTNPTIICSN